MLPTYQPAEGAIPVPPGSLALLSQRDLSLRVPINFVTHAGVALSSACFAHNVYDNDAAILCFSNLLASGFRRFNWDLYWDDVRRVWSFCPAQIPTQPQSGATTSSSSIRVSLTSATLSDATITARAASGIDEEVRLETLPRRQATATTLAASLSSTASLNTSLSSSTGTGTAVSIQPTQTSTPVSASGLIQVGSYACSPSLDVPILAAVLASYFSSTSNTLDATFLYLSFSLHVASPLDGPTSSPETLNSSSLPQAEELLSSLLSVNLTSYLYTPDVLKAERSDLNNTWLSSDQKPLLDYLNTTRNSKGVATTADGWPGEGYIEFSRPYRLVAGYDSIDPQLSLYNVSADESAIFPIGAIRNDITDVRFGMNGIINQGCLFKPNDGTIKGSNDSWAVSSQFHYPANSLPATINGTIPQVANLTDCGISAVLNSSILNTTADQDYSNYQDYVYSTIWSWSPGEPRNVSVQENDASRIRCAVVDGSLNGRWRVTDCADKHYAACRVNGSPYSWRVSTTKTTYTNSEDACSDDTSFGVPFTALESRHLFHEMQVERNDDQLVWVNMNSLSLAGCWVIGVNATCPYNGTNDADERRAVVVPVLAAVVVFVVAALTIFVKCAANRQNSRRKRRRKGDDNWDYEGVPS